MIDLIDVDQIQSFETTSRSKKYSKQQTEIKQTEIKNTEQTQIKNNGWNSSEGHPAELYKFALNNKVTEHTGK